jgi:hypothetical protein
MGSFPWYSEQPGQHPPRTGLQETDFVGDLRYWSTFPTDVRAVFNHTAWTAHPQPLSVRFSSDIGPNTLDKEHYRYGAENYKRAYVQHVLHVMTAVGRELRYGLAFGDRSATESQLRLSDEQYTQPVHDSTSSGTESSRKIKYQTAVPDYVLMDATSDARAIGKLNPWGTVPTQYVNEFLTGGFQNNLRHFLGKCDKSANNLT